MILQAQARSQFSQWWYWRPSSHVKVLDDHLTLARLTCLTEQNPMAPDWPIPQNPLLHESESLIAVACEKPLASSRAGLGTCASNASAYPALISEEALDS